MAVSRSTVAQLVALVVPADQVQALAAAHKTLQLVVASEVLLVDAGVGHVPGGER